VDNQLTLALERRHEGQDANLAAAVKPHMDLRSRVESIVAILAKDGVPFNADKIHGQLKKEIGEVYDRNVVSSVMGKWAQAGRIIRVPEKGITPSKEPTRNGSRNSWWIGSAQVRKENVA
jgi:hypothetical protein